MHNPIPRGAFSSTHKQPAHTLPAGRIPAARPSLADRVAAGSKIASHFTSPPLGRQVPLLRVEPELCLLHQAPGPLLHPLLSVWRLTVGGGQGGGVRPWPSVPARSLHCGAACAWCSAGLLHSTLSSLLSLPQILLCHRRRSSALHLARALSQCPLLAPTCAA